MKEEVHKEAAKSHLIIAEEYDQKYQKEEDQDKKIALRTVAAQNYFYSSINFIEALFAKKHEHSFNHENRYRKLLLNRNLFSEEILTLYDKVDRSQRNLVAYKGENGEKYLNMKKLAKLLSELK